MSDEAPDAPDDPVLADTHRIREHLHDIANFLQKMAGPGGMLPSMSVDLAGLQRQLGMLSAEVPMQGPSVRAVLRLPTQPTECGLSIAAIIVGAVLLAPGDTLASAPGYRPLGFLPEPFWGLGLVSLGIAQLAALFLAGRTSRRWCALSSMITWMVLTGLFAIGNPIGLGWALVIPLLAAALWIVVRGPS